MFGIKHICSGVRFHVAMTDTERQQLELAFIATVTNLTYRAVGSYRAKPLLSHGTQGGSWRTTQMAQGATVG